MSTQVTLFHGTFKHEVDKIKGGIKLETGKPASDFSAHDHPRAFYLTPDKKSAELWAKARRDWAGSSAAVSVIEYTLNKSGLKVHDFGTVQTGAEFEKWQQLLANNYGGKSTIAGFENVDVIIGYMSDGEKSSPKSYKVWMWDEEKPPIPMHQVAIMTPAAVAKLTYVRTIDVV